MEKDETQVIHDIAAQLVSDMVEAANDKDVCAHCVGLDLIYGIARTMAANMEVEPGELFNMVHIGVFDGESDRGDEPPDSGEFTGGTVH